MRPEQGLLVANRYRLDAPLASGGMGSVWVATHLGLDAKVAVKFMSDEISDSPSGRSRFEREAKAAARLTSPHVVRATDFGVDEGTPYMVMELLNGESLETRLRREVRMAPKDVARTIGEVVKGLVEAHAIGIVHRDLKPANIFLARVGGEEIAKILDFGIAKETQKLLVQDDDTQSGTLLGSPQHMSPEQVRGGNIDPRSDLWSLAAVAFRMLTGRRPFQGTNMADIVAKICVDPILKASDAFPALGSNFDAFFEKAFSRDPEGRFQSATELALAFDEAAARTTVQSPSALVAIFPREEVTMSILSPATAEPMELTTTGTTRDSVRPAPRKTNGFVAVAAVFVGLLIALGAYFWFRSNSVVSAQATTPVGVPNENSAAARATAEPGVVPAGSDAAATDAAKSVEAKPAGTTTIPSSVAATEVTATTPADRSRKEPLGFPRKPAEPTTPTPSTKKANDPFF